MQFIRLSALKMAFPETAFPLETAASDDFRTRFYAFVSGLQLTIPETEQWLSALAAPETILFMEWTEQETELAFLLDQQPKLCAFRNRTRITGHAMFPAFQRFITPFLHVRLVKLLADASGETLRDGMSFIPLMTERASEFVQQVVYDRLKPRQAKVLQNIAEAKTENELLLTVSKELNPVLIETLNGFTGAFYSAKTAWIEVLRATAEHKAATRRLVVHLSKELGKLHLNPDHKNELEFLEKSVRSGQVKVEGRRMPVKRVIALSIAGSAIVVLIVFLWKLPVEAEQQPEQERTSFMDFSVDERLKIDSLLQHERMEREHQDNTVDQSDLDYVGQQLQVKIPFANQDAERIFSKWESCDSTNIRPRTEDSKRDGRAFPTTEKLDTKKGTITARFQNDTELSVLIVVFRDKEDEYVYSEYVEKNAGTRFRLNPGEYLFVLPGSKVPEHLKAERLPFEQADSRFFDALGDRYKVEYGSTQSIKLVWKALNSHDFYLVDLNGALSR